MHRSACFSPCRTWRYSLTRTWETRGRILAVIGLNPSTADETQDDPTIRRLIRFATREDYGGIVMLNLFAFRATDPRAMKAAADPVGPENDDYLRLETRGRDVLCCWGTHGGWRGRGTAVRRHVDGPGQCLFHLGLSKGGHPKHPLYLRSDTPFQAWP